MSSIMTYRIHNGNPLPLHRNVTEEILQSHIFCTPKLAKTTFISFPSTAIQTFECLSGIYSNKYMKEYRNKILEDTIKIISQKGGLIELLLRIYDLLHYTSSDIEREADLPKYNAETTENRRLLRDKLGKGIERAKSKLIFFMGYVRSYFESFSNELGEEGTHFINDLQLV